MGFLSKIFKKTKVKTNASEEYKKLLELKSFLGGLFEQDKYISKRDYQQEVLKYRDVVDFFCVLINSDMLEGYCTKNNICKSDVEHVLEKFSNIEKIVDVCNEEFIKRKMISEKEYLDNILKKVDSNILLDEDQRKVILTDEDYCLVIAGAGAGKTTTVAAKVKYLVEKQNISPKQILVVSYTNKAVNELKEKINQDLKLECPIATFHSVGNAIIRKNEPDEKLNIVDNSKLFFVLRDYFKEVILKNESIVNKLILFFASYFDAPYEGDDLNKFFNQTAKSNFSTMRSELEDFKREIIDNRTKKSVTIQNETLRSHQEVEIANYLYLNNIHYEYEPIYQYNILYSKKPYTPDFIITQDEKTAYIEHFGISESGQNTRYSADELVMYKRAVNEKIKLHKKHGTDLIYTFSSYNDGKSIIEHLKEQLEEKGFIINPRSNKEVMEMIISGEENKYVYRLVNLLCRFISNFKVNGYTAADFDRMYHSTQNVRTKLFLEICSECYLEYEKYLKENRAIDFEDMINESARLLNEAKELGEKLDFKYVIVDEYQDISKQRFDLTTALSKVTNAKIIAVGDDWQSIYAFSGSDITLFTKFEEKMGYAKLLKIVKTYRNSQEVIDIAGNFIQKNKLQIEKTLISPKTITDPVIIYTYDNSYKKLKSDRRTGKNYASAHAVEVCLEQIMKYNALEGKKNGKILVLGRFGFDGDHLEWSGLFEYTNKNGKLRSVKYPELDITIMTAHASKGLGYDNVIIINGKNETYGFPSKIEDDPVLSLVIKGDRSYDYAEERRLFYVALTRTKNRVYIVAPENNPSEFLLEIKKDYKNVILRGQWNTAISNRKVHKTCPICGYPMQYKYKQAYGLRLYICTNEPEICGFMTNDYGAGKLQIMKCNCCRDGYLIVKSSKGEYFLGCTNYKPDGKGCNNSIANYTYNKIMEINNHNIQKEEVTVIKGEEIHTTQAPSEIIDTVELKKPAIQEVIYKKSSLNDVIYNILLALQFISKKKFYDTSMLLDVVKGEVTGRILKDNLNSVPGYGTVTMLEREELLLILDWMLKLHMIIKTKENYPVLHPTYEGMHYDETLKVEHLMQLKNQLEKEVILWEE